jgi:hypothetical protein
LIGRWPPAYPHDYDRPATRSTLRQGGLNGFATGERADPFGATHSSTSISAALGFAIANKLECAGPGDRGDWRRRVSTGMAMRP